MNKNKFEQIERLMTQNKNEDALRELIALEELENLTEDDLLTCMYLKSSLYIRMKEYYHGSKIAHELLEKLADVWYGEGKLDRALDITKKCLEIFNSINEKRGIVWSSFWLGYFYLHKGELDQALEQSRKGLSLREEIEDKEVTALLLNTTGLVYTYKGELDKSLDYYKRSLLLFEETDNQQRIAIAFNNIGESYDDKGDTKSAIECFEMGLAITRENNYLGVSAEILYQLIRRFFNILPQKTISNYLSELQQIKKDLESHISNQQYLLAKAITLKSSDRLTDKVTAQALFKEVAEEKIAKYELTVHAMINLGELLLFELKTTGSEAVLNELKQLSEKLLLIAKEQNSHWLVIETYILQSKLALLELDIDRSQKLLEVAQVIAEENGLVKLAGVILLEKDKVHEQLDKWNELIEQNASPKDTLELARLEDMIERMGYRKLYHTEEEVIKYAERARQIIEMGE